MEEVHYFRHLGTGVARSYLDNDIIFPTSNFLNLIPIFSCFKIKYEKILYFSRDCDHKDIIFF